ncbi:uncharacterized protein L203_106387 [Cryptococcus depauperatus CBS 7841]|uniref:Major facilitator superfamily (MFS) profile domain-containing protein n=1 Tax=Cryptococcus depauperatus CBS 7841 TaxID=1295531 RepID=A0AAJ8M3D9_9TREE
MADRPVKMDQKSLPNSRSDMSTHHSELSKTSSSMTVKDTYLEEPDATRLQTDREKPNLYTENKPSVGCAKDTVFPSTTHPLTTQTNICSQVMPICRAASTVRGRPNGNPLARMSSAQTVELQNELRRHISTHGAPSVRGSEKVMEVSKQLKPGGSDGQEELIVIDWLPDDPENPINFPRLKKHLILAAANLACFVAASNLSTCAILATWGVPYFEVSREVFVLTLTLPMIALAVAPLALAPLSESFGRSPIYHITSIITAILFIPQIWSKNFGGVLAARFFQGIGMSVSNSMVGGTVADLFLPSERGISMSLFALSVFCGQGLGVIFVGWTSQLHGIQWAYGLQAIIAAASVVFNIFFMRETRADVLLSHRAARLTKETGVQYIAVVDLETKDMWTLVRISLVRPLQYLVTEPIVSALSAWMGFAWTCIFLSQSSVILVFEAYGFNAAEAGTFEVTMIIGGLLGLISQYHQEYLYQRSARRHNGKAPPEVRLYWAAYGGLMFPLAFYVYAWTGRAGVVHWAVPAVALIFMNWGIFAIYNAVFTYLADAYEIYSSSAQAAHSFCRNLTAGIFPLFARQLYVNLGYPQASTLIASIGLLLSAAPILLVFYGKKLRARSKVTSQLCKDEEQRFEEGRP